MFSQHLISVCGVIHRQNTEAGLPVLFNGEDIIMQRAFCAHDGTAHPTEMNEELHALIRALWAY